MAANTTVSGSLTYSDKVALSPDAGAIIGQQRIDSPIAVPIDFFVLVDARGRNATDTPPPDSPPTDATPTSEATPGTPAAPTDTPPAAPAASPADDPTLS